MDQVAPPEQVLDFDPDMDVPLTRAAAAWKDFESVVAGIAAEVDHMIQN